MNAPHALDLAAAAARLGVSVAHGLSRAEASRRAAESGPNALEPASRTPVWRLLLDAATEPFVLLLAAAGGLALVVGEVRDGLLVLFGLVPIVGADVVTEYRGERALEALRAASAPSARARRDGRVLSIPASELVPGDIVLLQAGDVVARADWVIDLGPGGGHDGGRVIFEGRPAELVRADGSLTGLHLGRRLEPAAAG